MTIFKALLLTAAVWFVSCAPTFAQALPNDQPAFVLDPPNPHQYTLFANSGWDGNWYVGSNTCWIQKLGPLPAGEYSRAFVGARLGRMKIRRYGKNPWEWEPYPGLVYMALSSTTAWTPAQTR